MISNYTYPDPVDIPNYVDRPWNDRQGEVRVSSPLKSRVNDWMGFAEADNGLAGGASFRLYIRSLARSLANRASVSVVIIAAWLNLTVARYDDKRPAPSRNTGHRCSPNGLRISPSAFTASWLWHVGRVCKQASEHRIHTPYHVFQAP